MKKARKRIQDDDFVDIEVILQTDPLCDYRETVFYIITFRAADRSGFKYEYNHMFSNDFYEASKDNEAFMNQLLGASLRNLNQKRYEHDQKLDSYKLDSD